MSMSIKDAGRLGLALGGLMVGAVVVAVLVVLGLAILSGPARAQGFTFGPGASGFGAAPRAPSAAAAKNSTFLQILTDLSLTTNLKLVLDAGDGSSYTSGQSWLDRSGAGYDFFRGADVNASTDDPTFNGTANAVTASEYWSFDGGDFFIYDSANEAWMDTLHKDAAQFCMATVFYVNAVSVGPLLNTADPAVGTDSGIEINAQGGSGGALKILVDHNNGATYALNKTADTSASNNTWTFQGLCIDEAGGANGSFFYKDGGYNQSGAADTWDGAYTTPTAVAATNTMQIGRRPGASSFLPSGARVAIMAVWQGGLITKANFDSIWTQIRTRFGL